MQAAREAFKDVREKGKSFVKPKYADQLLGSGLEEQIRRATAKSLPGPDLALNRRIVETINAELNQYSAHQLASVLKTRLTLKNAHKQWLALELVQEILEGCPKVIEPARSDILEDVAQIAAQPMNRYGSDLPGQQHCKNASFALLKKYGHEGQDAMREAVGLGSVTRYDEEDVPELSRLGQGRKPTNEPYSSKSDAYNSKSDAYNSRNGTYGRDSHREGSSNADGGFSAVRERVQMGIATSHSHTEVLQDMVLNLSEGSSKRDVDHDKSILKDLVKEMVTFRNKFEGTLEALSQFETREAQSLMTEALEAMDTMNNAIVLQHEVLTARKTKSQDSFGRSTSSTSSQGGGGPASRLPPPPGASSFANSSMPGQQQHQAPPLSAAPVQPQQPSYMDAFAELQQAMDNVHMSQGPPTPQQGDPFASSYLHPSGQSGDPHAQASFGQPSAPIHHQQAPSQSHAASHNPFAADGGFAPQGEGPGSGSYPTGQLTPTPPLGSASSVPPQSFSAPQSYGNAPQSWGGAAHTYSGVPQQRGPAASYNAPAADPFDHLPYPALGLSRPNKPERAPAPPLASYGKGAQAAPQQLQGQQEQRSMHNMSGSQPLQPQSNSLAGNIWGQPEASHKDSAPASFEFGESAFNPTPPQQSEVRPKEPARPRNLYINSLYGAEDGAVDEQPPPGFDPSQQALTRGTGSWGVTSPASSPGRGGGYMGGSGPPTPEGLQYQHQTSAGSSAATTPAQSAGNSEWDMFFANRVQPNGNAGPEGFHPAQPPQQQHQQQQTTSQMPDAFDELLYTRSR